jgi:hypothetical protein
MQGKQDLAQFCNNPLPILAFAQSMSLRRRPTVLDLILAWWLLSVDDVSKRKISHFTCPKMTVLKHTLASNYVSLWS